MNAASSAKAVPTNSVNCSSLNSQSSTIACAGSVRVAIGARGRGLVQDQHDTTQVSIWRMKPFEGSNHGHIMVRIRNTVEVKGDEGYVVGSRPGSESTRHDQTSTTDVTLQKLRLWLNRT